MKNSKSILLSLFDGDISLADKSNTNEKEHQKILRKLASLECHFHDTLSPEDWQRFEEFTELQLELACIDEDNVFVHSFTLGMSLMMEVMQEARSFCQG